MATPAGPLTEFLTKKRESFRLIALHAIVF